MLRTALCDVLGIDVPIILAAMGGTASSAEFAAAASNEGALGSIASLFRTNAASLRYRPGVVRLGTRKDVAETGDEPLSCGLT
jgi:NAD(P)H-dependent flavin oxidoreductase YrpB (nitropropane dioxygenase family)